MGLEMAEIMMSKVQLDSRTFHFSSRAFPILHTINGEVMEMAIHAQWHPKQPKAKGYRRQTDSTESEDTKAVE